MLQYRPKGKLKFAMRHGGVVVGGVEEKYRHSSYAAATESCSWRRQRSVAVAGETQESRRWMEERWSLVDSLPC
jgi:hypothetical protein